MPKEDKLVSEWTGILSKADTAREPYLANMAYYEQMYDDNLWGGNGYLERSRKSSQNTKGFIEQVNMLESIVLSIVPAVHFYDPVFEITPVFEEYRYAAQILEVFATRLYELLGLDEIIEDIIMDTLILGAGIHKVGFDYEIESALYQLGDATAGNLEVTNENIFSNDVSPMKIHWDYRVNQWKDIRWLSETIVKPLDEVKKSDLYSNTKELTGNINSSDVKKKFLGRDQTADLVVLHEIHDLKNSQIITIAKGHPKVLRKDDDYGFQIYDLLTFTKSRPRRIFGKSIAQSIEEHTIAIAKTLHYMASHGKRAGLTKVLVEGGSLDKKAIEKLESSNDFEIIGVDGLGQGTSVQELKFSQVGVDWMIQYNLRDQVIRMQTGVPLQERGRHEPGVETAFEVAKLAEASDRRNQQRIKKVNKFVASIMEKMLRIASENFQPVEIAAMVGLPAEFAPFIKPYDRMKLDVKFGSTALAARQEKANSVMSFVTLATQAGVQFDPVGIARLMAEAYGIELRESMILTGTPFMGTGGASGGGQDRSPAPARQPQLGARNNLGDPR